MLEIPFAAPGFPNTVLHNHIKQTTTYRNQHHWLPGKILSISIMPANLLQDPEHIDFSDIENKYVQCSSINISFWRFLGTK